MFPSIAIMALRLFRRISNPSVATGKMLFHLRRGSSAQTRYMAHPYYVLRSRLVIVLFWYVCLMPGRVTSQPVISLKDEVGTHILGDRMEVLEDASQQLTLDDIRTPTYGELFQRSNDPSPSFAYRSSAIWLRFRLRTLATSNSMWFLVFENPNLSSVELFSPTPDGRYVSRRAGIGHPQERRELDHRYISFLLNLRNSTEQLYFVRVISENHLALGAKIVSPQLFGYRFRLQELLWGIYFGVFVTMFLYTLFLFVSWGDRGHLYYALHAIGLGVFQAHYHGFTQHYLLEQSVWWGQHMFALSIGWIVVFGSQFLKILLMYDRHRSRIDKTLWTFTVAGGGLIILSLVLSQSISEQLAIFVINAFTMFAVIAAIQSFRDGYAPARYFLPGIAALSVGLWVRGLQIINWLPDNYFTAHALDLGTIIEVICFSLAFRVRITLAMQEKEDEKARMRSRIASDLHDEVGSNLSMISVATQIMQANHRLPAAYKEQLSRISSAASETMDSIRDIVWFVDPDHDTSANFIFKMKNTATKMLNGTDFTLDSNIDGQFDGLGVESKRNLFLIYKEAIHNIAKHSRASCVKVHFNIQGGNVVLAVQDNGAGFDQAAVEAGQGLRNFRTRAAQMGGTVQVTSSPGGGTTVQLQAKTA